MRKFACAKTKNICPCGEPRYMWAYKVFLVLEIDPSMLEVGEVTYITLK